MWYDIVCLVILALSVWRGMAKGFVWQLASIAGIVLCFIFAETVSIAVAPMTGLEPPLSRWVAILGLYIVGSFFAFAMARSIQAGLEKAKFEDYDRHLGAVFGGIKGAVICLVATFFLFTLSEQSRELVIHSNSGYASAVLFEQIQPVMPAELEALLEPYMDGFDRETMAEHRRNHQVDEGPDLFDVHGDHGGHDHDHDDDGHTVSPISSGSNSSRNPFGETVVDNSIQDLVNKIPGLFSPELQQIVYETLQSTDPKDRPELMEKLSSGMPGVVRQVAEQWQNGKPVNAAEPLVTDWRQHRAYLLREIAAIYTEHTDAQRSIMEEVVYALHGVPDAVTVSILEDWHADLMGKQPDPDPSTDIATTLDRRVVNQLAKARISLGSLPSDLRDRLSSVR